MEYKIVEKPAFTFAGVSKRVPLQYEGVNNAILKLAQSITQKQKEEMHRLQNIEPYETVNVSYESDTNFFLLFILSFTTDCNHHDLAGTFHSNLPRRQIQLIQFGVFLKNL